MWFAGLGFGERFAHVLDGEERARGMRFMRTDDRLRYASAHALARHVLGGHLRIDPAAIRFEAVCTRCGGPHGKPVVRGSADRVSFSLSHSGDRVVVAATCGIPVGVDVERESAAARALETSELVLATNEREMLARLPEDERARAFLRMWTRKEALLKATGDGLAVAPREVDVSAPVHGEARLYDLDAGEQHVAALAIVHPSPLRVIVRQADELR